MVGPDIQLITPESEEDWQETRLILRDYAASLEFDLDFQGFDEELATLPGAYAQPEGLMLLALVDGAVAGSGAFRPLPDADYPNACEMKRLFVRPAFRRFGLGRQGLARTREHALNGLRELAWVGVHLCNRYLHRAPLPTLGC